MENIRKGMLGLIESLVWSKPQKPKARAPGQIKRIWNTESIEDIKTTFPVSSLPPFPSISPSGTLQEVEFSEDSPEIGF